MKISVVIPTYNGAHRILNILRSLELQTHLPEEVIVVIDGSTDNTSKLLQEQTFKLRNLKIVEQENQGRAKVRNRGAAEANGELLIFVDDDIIVPAEWVESHLSLHKRKADCIVTGGLREIGVEHSDFLRFKVWLHKKWTNNLPADASDFLLSTPYITANNFSLKKCVFQRLHGFDPRLRDAEDYDMAKRAMLLGIPIYFSNTAFAWNNDVDNVTCAIYIRRLRQYTKAQEILASLKPELYSSEHQYASPAPHGLKGLLFTAFCKRWWISSVDEGKWKWLPSSLRYKLYDLIVTANGSFFPNKVRL